MAVHVDYPTRHALSDAQVHSPLKLPRGLMSQLSASSVKEKPEPRGSGSRELHNLSSYKKIIANPAL